MLTYRKATAEDTMLYFEWANDETVRLNSINRSNIELADHIAWFNRKVAAPDTIMLLFLENDKAIGQLRIEIEHESNEAVINYSIAKESRGKGFGTTMLAQTWEYFSRLGIKYPLVGFVKPGNIASISAFVKAGYEKLDGLFTINNEPYFKFSKCD